MPLEETAWYSLLLPNVSDVGVSYTVYHLNCRTTSGERGSLNSQFLIHMWMVNNPAYPEVIKPLNFHILSS